MSVTAQEISSQPALWVRAAELAAELDGVLPAAGEEVCVIGCGTSWFMGQAYAALRESCGHGRTDAFAASEMPFARLRRRARAVALGHHDRGRRAR